MLIRKTKTYWVQVIALTLAGLIPLPLQAGVIPGRWEEVAHLEAGSRPILEMKSGDRIKGHFMDLSETDLELLIHPSRVLIPKADFLRIKHHPRDGLGDGIGRGAAVGAAGAGIGALFGVGIGFVSDAVVKSPWAVVYEAR